LFFGDTHVKPSIPNRFSIIAPLLVLTACGSAPDPAQPHGADRSPPVPAAAVRETPPVLPAVGQIAIEDSPGGLRVLANQVPRIEVLHALQSAFGFELELGQLDAAIEATPLTLIEIDASLEDVLFAVLAGISFEVTYSADPTRGEHLLSRVLVAGARRDRGALARETRGRGPDRAERRKHFSGRRAEGPTRAERAREAAERAEVAARRIGSDDPEERRRAAEALRIDRDGIEKLGEVVASDPDPRVRAAAAERLGEDESLAAVQHLLDALRDPDPLVIIAALDALAFAGDESIVAELEFLLDHPDPEVRATAWEVIQFLS